MKKRAMNIVLSSICLESGTDIQLALYYLKSYLLQRPAASALSLHVLPRVFNENQSVAKIVQQIISLKPHLIGFSCYVWNIEKTLQVCSELKKARKTVVIVVGGPEVSSRAQELLAQYPALDIVVRGEGEGAFADVAEAFARGEGVQRLLKIKGISLRNGMEIMETADRPLLRNLGAIPSPYLTGLIDLKDKNIEDVPLETARGCAYRCKYCYYHKNSPLVRHFPLLRVSKELALILSHKPHEVYLMDATFNSDPVRAKKILRLFIKYNRGSNLHVELRAELIDEELAGLLSQANAYNIEIGIQSTNVRTLRAVRRPFDRQKFSRGIRALNAQGLFYEIQLIDALPFQQYNDLQRSLDWLYSLHPAKVIIFPLAMLPGASLRQEASRFGIVFDPKPPYWVRRSHAMTEVEVQRVEQLGFAMERLYDSQVFQKTLFALRRKTGIRISDILESWIMWEQQFKERGVEYVEFLNRKLPDFLKYVCQRHGRAEVYKELLPGLVRALPDTREIV